MAFTDLGQLASGGSSGNNQASLTVATSASCAAGELVVVCVAVDNQATGGGDDLSTSGVVLNTSGGALVLALTKGRQNASNLAAQAGVSTSLWWGVLPVAYASGGNIVASFTTAATSDATALTARHFSFVGLINSVAVENTNVVTTSASVTPGSLNATTASIACLRIRATGCEYDSTQTITTTSTWTTWTEGASAATGTITEQAIECEHLISTGTGAASNPTLGSACDSASVYVAFKELENPKRLPILDLPPRGPLRGREYWIDAVGFIEAAGAETLPADAGAYALTGSDAALTATTTANLPAGGANWFNPWGPRRGRQDWSWFNTPLFLVTPVTLTAAGGSYTLTGGAAVNLAIGQAAGSGSYALTGSSAAQAFGQAAGSGTYTLTGSAAALALGHVAGAGSYSLTGSNAALALGLGAGAGSYTLTGADAAFVIPGGLSAAAGSYTLTGSDAALTATSTANLPAGAVNWFNPWGRRFPINLRTIAVRGQIAPTATILTADAGSYALTGSEAALTAALPAGMTGGYVPWGRRFPINLRTIAVRGQIAPTATILTADAGSYALTGSDAALTATSTGYLPAGMTGGYAPWGRPPRQDWFWSVAYVPGDTTLSAGAGSYALTGSDAALTVTTFQYIIRPPLIRRLWARSRTVAVSSQAWILRNTFVGSIRLTADAGSYTLTGSSAGSAFALTAGSGTYSLTGFAAVSAQALPADAGSYTLTGSPAGWALVLTAEAGSYALTGSAQTPVTGFPVDAGSYALTGSDAAFVGGTTGNNYVLTCNVGSYGLTGGSDANLALVLPAGSGSYSLTGSAAELTVGNVFLGADAGSYTITGSDAVLALGLSVNSGAYALTGDAAPLTLGFGAAAGSYAYSGADAQLHQAGTIVLVCEAGSYVLTGGDVSFLGVIPPIEIIPSPGGVGGRPVYKRLKLKKKLKREECEELLAYLRSLPAQEMQQELIELASRPDIASLLNLLPAASGVETPSSRLMSPVELPAGAIQDDDDEECIALLLEILNA